MHVFATNLCVWIKTVFVECTKELTFQRGDVNSTNQGQDEIIISG